MNELNELLEKLYKFPPTTVQGRLKAHTGDTGDQPAPCVSFRLPHAP
jgi:hypothetical protein